MEKAKVGRFESGPLASFAGRKIVLAEDAFDMAPV